MVVTAKMDPPDPKDLTYCSVTHVFGDGPSAIPGSHALSVLACLIDGNGKKQCPGSTLARKTYVILPTPTLKLTPGTGLAAAAFTATYDSGELTCSTRPPCSSGTVARSGSGSRSIRRHAVPTSTCHTHPRPMAPGRIG